MCSILLLLIVDFPCDVDMVLLCSMRVRVLLLVAASMAEKSLAFSNGATKYRIVFINNEPLLSKQLQLGGDFTARLLTRTVEMQPTASAMAKIGELRKSSIPQIARTLLTLMIMICAM
jgi:hypothetical protein